MINTWTFFLGHLRSTWPFSIWIPLAEFHLLMKALPCLPSVKQPDVDSLNPHVANQLFSGCLNSPWICYVYEGHNKMVYFKQNQFNNMGDIVLQVHACFSVDQISVPVYSQIIFHCVHMPHFIFPFVSWWTFGLHEVFRLLWTMMLWIFMYEPWIVCWLVLCQLYTN